MKLIQMTTAGCNMAGLFGAYNQARKLQSSAVRLHSDVMFVFYSASDRKLHRLQLVSCGQSVGRSCLRAHWSFRARRCLRQTKRVLSIDMSPWHSVDRALVRQRPWLPKASTLRKLKKVDATPSVFGRRKQNPSTGKNHAVRSSYLN
jgi:hypothetical protein